MIAVLLLLLTHIVWSVRSVLVDDGVSEPSTPVGGPRFLETASTLARDGRHLEAAHQVLLASIQTLVENGAIELERHHANRTLRRRLASSNLAAGERAEFTALLDELETRWFRDRSSDPTLYERWLRLHDRLATGPANG